MPDLGSTAFFPLVWMTPIAAGIIASEWMTRHYKRKFGDLPSKEQASKDKETVSA